MNIVCSDKHFCCARNSSQQQYQQNLYYNGSVGMSGHKESPVSVSEKLPDVTEVSGEQLVVTCHAMEATPSVSQYSRESVNSGLQSPLKSQVLWTTWQEAKENNLWGIFWCKATHIAVVGHWENSGEGLGRTCAGTRSSSKSQRAQFVFGETTEGDTLRCIMTKVSKLFKSEDASQKIQRAEQSKPNGKKRANAKKHTGRVVKKTEVENHTTHKGSSQWVKVPHTAEGRGQVICMAGKRLTGNTPQWDGQKVPMTKCPDTHLLLLCHLVNLQMFQKVLLPKRRRRKPIAHRMPVD